MYYLLYSIQYIMLYAHAYSGHRQSDCTMPRKDKSKREINKSTCKRDNCHKKGNSESGSDNESIRMLRDGGDFPSRESWIRSEFNHDEPAAPFGTILLLFGIVVCEIGRSTSTNYKTKKNPVASQFKQSSVEEPAK